MINPIVDARDKPEHDTKRGKAVQTVNEKSARLAASLRKIGVRP